MEYRVELGKEVLVRTPTVLRSVLSGLPDEWTSADEGPGPGRAVRSEGDGQAVHGCGRALARVPADHRRPLMRSGRPESEDAVWSCLSSPYPSGGEVA
jgi:hypothetical protein